MEVIKNNKVTWINILNPTREDIVFIKKQHKFHQIILDELLQPSVRSRVEKYDSYLYLIYHLPIYDRSKNIFRKTEIDFLITKNKLITIHYEELEPINSFIRSLESNPHLKESALETTFRLVYEFIEEIISFSFHQLRRIEDNVNYISQEIFKNQGEKMLERISYIKRDALDFYRISRPQEILLNSLVGVGTTFWGESAKVYLFDLVGDYLKMSKRLENYVEIIKSLEITNAQLLNAKTNAIMRKFTILAFLTFPLVLYSSILQIPMVARYFSEDSPMFWLGFGVVLAITLIALLIFRKKSWL